MYKSPGYTWSFKFEFTVESKQLMKLKKLNHYFAGKVYGKQIIGGIQFAINLVFCPEQAREIWVSDNGQFSVVLARLQAATVQQICIQAVVRAAI